MPRARIEKQVAVRKTSRMTEARVFRLETWVEVSSIPGTGNAD
jgi:hypothetical protein